MHYNYQNYFFKVETIGDAYMVVSGLPWLKCSLNDTLSKQAGQHACEIVEMAFDMLDNIVTLKNPINQSPMKIRVGNNK